jgi:hypothetical protein
MQVTKQTIGNGAQAITLETGQRIDLKVALKLDCAVVPATFPAHNARHSTTPVIKWMEIDKNELKVAYDDECLGGCGEHRCGHYKHIVMFRIDKPNEKNASPTNTQEVAEVIISSDSEDAEAGDKRKPATSVAPKTSAKRVKTGSGSGASWVAPSAEIEATVSKALPQPLAQNASVHWNYNKSAKENEHATMARGAKLPEGKTPYDRQRFIKVYTTVCELVDDACKAAYDDGDREGYAKLMMAADGVAETFGNLFDEQDIALVEQPKSSTAITTPLEASHACSDPTLPAPPGGLK